MATTSLCAFVFLLKVQSRELWAQAWSQDTARIGTWAQVLVEINFGSGSDFLTQSLWPPQLLMYTQLSHHCRHTYLAFCWCSISKLVAMVPSSMLKTSRRVVEPQHVNIHFPWHPFPCQREKRGWRAWAQDMSYPVCLDTEQAEGGGQCKFADFSVKDHNVPAA